MQPERKQGNQNAVNLAVDLVIFLIFLVVEAPKFSGLPVHEWLGIAIGAGALTHVLLHWSWVIEISKRFFGKAQALARVNYVLNLLLFLAIVTIIFTGLMISETVMPLLGITVAQNRLWRGVHTTAANVFILLVALHVALHWQWFVNLLRRSRGTTEGARRTP
jgi:cytochrome b subunit of formate dehydrogenase